MIQPIDNIDFTKAKILVIGDLMLDEFIYGQVNRISPESPVPILDQKEITKHLGGAANVAMNIKALGASVSICSIIGNDNNGLSIINMLLSQDINIQYIYQSENRKTCRKTRVVNDQQQLLRIDYEDTHDLDQLELEVLSENITKAIKHNTPNVILLQDYNKGVLTKQSIKFIKKIAKDNDISICVDPKFNNFTEYSNVLLFKPNLKEFQHYLKKEITDINMLADEMIKFQRNYDVNFFMLTLGEKGVLISDKNSNKWQHIETTPLDNAFVSGAGDTVISTASVCLALHIDYVATAKIANIAGRMACSKPGIAVITGKELLYELKTSNLVQ